MKPSFGLKSDVKGMNMKPVTRGTNDSRPALISENLHGSSKANITFNNMSDRYNISSAERTPSPANSSRPNEVAQIKSNDISQTVLKRTKTDDAQNSILTKMRNNRTQNATVVEENE